MKRDFRFYTAEEAEENQVKAWVMAGKTLTKGDRRMKIPEKTMARAGTRWEET